jgi:hypothetical protein
VTPDSPTAELELQNLWLALQKKSWRVLAVVPAMRQIASLDVASAIAEVAWQYRGEPTVVLDLRDITLRLVDYHKKEIEEHVKKGEYVIVALASINQNPTSIALAKSADSAVLVVRVGETPMKASVRAVEEIGHDKFVGTIISRKKPRAALPVKEPEKQKEKEKVSNKTGSTLVGVGAAVPVTAPVAAADTIRQTVKMPARGGAKS